MNCFRQVLNVRKEYRIGSRPIDLVTPALSRNRNSRKVTEENMQDLQGIVFDFEKTYSSPQRINESPTPRSGNFVKRMVAALEQKYNERRDSRRNTPKSKGTCVNANDEFSIRHTPMNKTFIIKPRCRSVDRLPHTPDNFPFFVEENRHDITELTFEIEEGLPSRKKNTPPKRNDQVIEVDKKNSPGPSGKSNSKKEKAPKIVGAFLKKPIEVEETEIHWIPITNEKLPRKSSFQKLVSLLTGKKSPSRNSKLCSVENKMNENALEPRDSGYDDKTSSPSSSLSSKTSQNCNLVRQAITAAIHQKNAPMSSFQSSPGANIHSEKNPCPTLGELARKLMLTEVPRSNVRLSRGPFSPIPIRDDEFTYQETTMNESEEEICTYENVEVYRSNFMPPLPKHPFVTPLPKHPFVSEHPTYMEPYISITSEDIIGEFSPIDLSEIPAQEEYPLSKCVNGAPRNSISISSPDIGLRGDQIRSDLECNNDDSYNLPPPHVLLRRKSCIFEDAVSLKRRSACFESTSNLGSNFYACPDEEQFATINPRNNKILPSQELLRSMADNDFNQLQSPYLVNRLSHFDFVF